VNLREESAFLCLDVMTNALDQNGDFGVKALREYPEVAA
jgi:hypothetical protein